VARNFPDLLEAWLEYVKHSAAPDIYKRWAFISAIAGALERKVWLMQGHNTGYYANLYIFLIGPPGSGKSTIADVAMGLLQEVEGVDFLATELNRASLFYDLAAIGHRKRFEWLGESFPHSAATLYASEASQAFSEQYKGGGIISSLTDFYNGGPIGWSLKHGVSRSTRKDGGVVMCLNPCINLLACSTATWFTTKCITRNDAEGGFGSRILLAVTHESLKLSGEWDETEPATDMKLRRRIVEDLNRIHKLRGPYTPDLSFRRLHPELVHKYQAWETERRQLGLSLGYSTRKLTQLYKLTMVLAASRRDELVLTGRDLQDAWDMLAEIEPAMIELFDEVSITPEALARREIMRWLTEAKRSSVRRAELYTKFPHISDTVRNAAIQGLLAMGRFEIVDAANANTLFRVHLDEVR